MRESNSSEVLAPAGSWDSMVAAINAGADAVYMGGTRFGARAYAENPDDHGLLEAIDYVHLHGKRLYLTVNTLLKERELEDELEAYLRPLYEQGLDAVIVQDYGVLDFVREHFPGMDIHISTQMTVAGPYGAKLTEQLGASRLVLPRELSLEEVREIHQATAQEIEAFVHGALCYCYSGQCLMSSLIGGRSGNRGRCAQPCRLPWNGSHLLNLKDMCTLDILPDILEAGVYSLKIEGRMKSPRYTAGVVSIYRKYVDLYEKEGRSGYHVDPADREFLLMLFDRGGFSEGYYRHHNGAEMVFRGDKPKMRRVDENVMKQIDQKYVLSKKQEKIKGSLKLFPGESATLRVSCGACSVNICGAEVMTAQKQPLQIADVDKRFRKTGDTPFCWEELRVELGEGAFLRVGAMNQLRRDALAALEKEIIDGYRRIN